MRYNERGEELPDPTEVEVPVGLRRPPTLAEQIKAMVRSELSLQAAAEGFESFEEADDFDVEEDAEMVIDSPHEMTEEQEFRDASDLERPENPPAAGGAVNPRVAQDTAGPLESERGARSPARDPAGPAVSAVGDRGGHTESQSGG